MKLNVEEIQKLLFINAQGQQYLGKVETGSGVTVISEAIIVDDQDSFEQTLVEYIKAKNINQLDSINLIGETISYSTKSLSAQQKMSVSILVAKATFAIEYAVANLQNDAIDAM